MVAINGWKRSVRLGVSWRTPSSVTVLMRAFCGSCDSLPCFGTAIQRTPARPFSASRCARLSPDAASNRLHQRPIVRSFSSNGGGVVFGAEPMLHVQGLQESIMKLAPAMAKGLMKEGYWTTTRTENSVLPMNIIDLIRKQAVELRRQGRFEQSWSERVVDGISTERFDKDGVFACEPDGRDYEIAPDMIVYMSVLLQTLPLALNRAFGTAAPEEQPNPDLSNSSFNAKLAVTLPGGSTYPLHVDNPQGLAANDIRKLTCILYLNPNYDAARGDGGELRLMVGNPEDGEGIETTPTVRHIDLTPEGGRMVLFWSDEIPHEVLPTAPGFFQGVETTVDEGEIGHNPLDRYALTVWIPTENISTIHNESSKFRSLRELAFPEASS